jgi:hypothetical protein
MNDRAKIIRVILNFNSPRIPPFWTVGRQTFAASRGN